MIVYSDWTKKEGQVTAIWHKQNSGKDIVIHPPYSSMCWIEDNKIKASALFNNYSRYSIDVHVCMPRTLSRQKIRDMFSYAFDFLKVRHVRSNPSRDNKLVIKVFERLDFTHEATLNEYWGDGSEKDALIYSYSREKYINRITRGLNVI